MKTAAVIGCGRAIEGKEGWAIGHAHADAYLAGFPEINLIGVDIDADNLAAFGEKFDVPDDRLFDSTDALYAALTPDAVSICTWPGLHRSQVIEAAEAGVKAITCEKPMALDGSEIDDMIAAVSKAGARLSIAHQRCYEPPFRQARDLIRDGAIGERLVLHARVGDGWDILSWTVHWFDMARFLFDAPATSVMAGVDHTGTRRYRHAVEDASVIFVEYTPTRQATFITGPIGLPENNGITVVGDRGMLRIAGTGVDVFNESGHTRHTTEWTFRSGFPLLFRDLWQAVQDPDHTPEAGVAHTAAATRLAYAAHESARTMRRIDLPRRDLGYAPLEVAQHPPRRTGSLGRVVLLADAHHADPDTGEGGREGLRDALQTLGADTVHLVPAEQREPTADDLADADLLVIYHTQRESTPAVRELIGDWITSGRPTLIAHCGIGAYADWVEYRKWIGRFWVWSNDPTAGDLPISGHPHVPCVLNSVDTDQFDPGFDTAWLPRDEVYVNLGVLPGVAVTDRVTADYPGGSAPICWQADAMPNVMTWAPGHRREIFRLDVMRRGLRACIARVMQ